jgi:hypothetical protein
MARHVLHTSRTVRGRRIVVTRAHDQDHNRREVLRQVDGA